ncbi:Hypothetical predicted protein, partial [Mytilus galloprovincialis]
MPPPLANKINTKDNKEIKNKDGNKTVQSLLAPKKDQQIANQGNPPPKRDKRTFSDVSEESLEGIDLMSIHSDLKDIKKSLQNTVKKSDLDNLVKQKDLKDLVTTIVSKLLSTLKESITEEFNTKLKEKTGKLKDEIDALNIDNENFKERLRTKDRQIEELQEKVSDCNHRSIDALKSANYNEQYSRKHNIRMVNFPEKRNENLRDVFVKMVKKDLNVEIEPSDVIAIHRIPGKEDPWRTCHPDDKKFTWRQTSPIKQSRLDYFLVSEDLFSLMKNAKIIPGYKTDHSAIVFTFSASLDKRAPTEAVQTNLNDKKVELESMREQKIEGLLLRKKIKEVSAILKSWQHRKLTLLGKITVIKTLALPRLIHLLTALPNLPHSQLNELSAMFFNFIWNGKTDRVKRSTLIADFSQGGLNMVHLQSFCTYLKLSWVKRFLSNSDGTWQNLLLAELKQLGGDRVFTLQKDKIKEISNRLKNPFWKDIFECLHMAKPYTKLCVPEILSLDILNFIPISEYPVYMKWKLYGIQFIRDIVDSQSKSLLTFQQ